MHASPFFDRSLPQILALGSISYEKWLIEEQLNFFTIGKIEVKIKNASKEQLLLLHIRLDYDVKAYPRKAYFFNALLTIVKKQLGKKS